MCVCIKRYAHTHMIIHLYIYICILTYSYINVFTHDIQLLYATGLQRLVELSPRRQKLLRALGLGGPAVGIPSAGSPGQTWAVENFTL